MIRGTECFQDQMFWAESSINFEWSVNKHGLCIILHVRVSGPLSLQFFWKFSLHAAFMQLPFVRYKHFDYYQQGVLMAIYSTANDCS